MWRRATFTHPSIGAYNDSCPPDRCPHAHQVFDSGGKLLTTILWPCHTHFDVLHNAPNSNAFIITRIGRHTPHFYSIHTAQYSQLTSDDPTSSERVASVYSIYADIRPLILVQAQNCCSHPDVRRRMKSFVSVDSVWSA